MIDKRNVVLLKIPYSDIYSGLAKKSHMYICYKKVHDTKRLVKCQSLKLGNIVGAAGIANFIVESANIVRNPFAHPTLIDCDKLFSVDAIIPKTLLTKTRPDISQALYDEIDKKLSVGGQSKHKLSKDELHALNPDISR